MKVSVSDCAIDEKGLLTFRGRKWVPDYEALRTKLLELCHSTPLAGHPGRHQTYTNIAREYFWPNQAFDVRRFVQNCDICGRTKPWRQVKQGFLKPLPIADQQWQEQSIDFIVGLPESDSCTTLMVITDRLGKGVKMIELPDIEAETVAWAWIRWVFRLHGVPRAIVTDRGTQFTGFLWRTICRLLKIERRISTAFHPQTDGSTERKNSEIEVYLRTFCNHAQTDWVRLLPIAELSLNARQSATTGVSPFLLSHGYDLPLLSVREPSRTEPSEASRSTIEKGEAIVRKIQLATDWAKASMASAQEDQQRQANRTRQASPLYSVGDKVWLNLENFRTTRQSKKLDWKNAKYTITQIIGSHNVRLDTPAGPHNVFHVDHIRLAGNNPFPTQQNDDTQPDPTFVDGEEQYEIEKILDESYNNRTKKTKYLVKWKGWVQTTWEPSDALEDAQALDVWIKETKLYRSENGRLSRSRR